MSRRPIRWRVVSTVRTNQGRWWMVLTPEGHLTGRFFDSWRDAMEYVDKRIRAENVWDGS